MTRWPKRTQADAGHADRKGHRTIGIVTQALRIAFLINDRLVQSAASRPDNSKCYPASAIVFSASG